MSDVRVGSAELKDFAQAIMRAFGVDEAQIQTVADNLIWSELVGRSNFGVQRLPIHMKRVEAGVLSCPCRLEFHKCAEAVELLDGGGGFGHHAAWHGMERAIELARAHGVAAVGVRNSNFFGAGAYYAQQAAGVGMIGFALSNSFPKVVAHGGREPVLGTNPFAFAAPRRNGHSLLLDMATSALAGSTIRQHIESGEPLAPGLAMDSDGNPITDARRVEAGALLPFGGAKGYGLALMVEVLCGVMTGAGVSNGVASMYNDFERSGDNGHFLLALDIARLMPLETYYQRLESLIDVIKGSSSGQEVLVPGEARWKAYASNSVNGIALGAETQRQLGALARSAGVATPWD